MAAPFNHEDLAKLKSFLAFVEANPTILNLPELDFFKKLIEKFGGVVPEGTFQMPAGSKCPFGGDIKSENTAAAADKADEVTPEMEVEAESEESEVELDMEANNMTVLEPNILYLDEKPPKIFKTKKNTTKIKSARKTRSKMKAKRRKLSRKQCDKLKQDYIVKRELRLSEEKGEKIENSDPLNTSTAKLEIKNEVDEENQLENSGYNFEVEEPEADVGGDHDYDYEYDIMENKLEIGMGNDDHDDDHDEDDDDDDDDDDEYDDNGSEEQEDEPLIVLARRTGRPRKKYKDRDEGKIRSPRSVVCREICKQHCTEKFSEEQRASICEYFWNLSKEDRLAFIRKHTRARRLTRMKRVNAVRSRGNNCCYYLKNYSIGSDETIPSLSSDLTRVCRKFFEATLCTTNHYIKKANDGSILEIEKDLLLLHEIKMAKEKEKSKEPQQILDPETGNLITLDSKTSQTGKPKPSQDKNAEKKRSRRKRGDPEPEHFPKPIKCEQRCIHKCHTKFTEEERKQICDFFWSMDYKRRKDFTLANMEIKDIETETTPDFRKTNRPPRAYQSRFYMRSGGTRGERVRVCKDFYGKTLCINRYFIKNAIEFADKTTGYYTGTDRRGVHGAPNKISDERRQTVIDHIESYPYWVPNKKSKTKYLHHSLTIKKMFEAYKEKCEAAKVDYVSSHYYYKVFHANFHVLFLANPHPRKGGGFLKANPNISHYTGDEAGGYWIDFKGNRLDLRLFNPALTLDVGQSNFLPDNARNPPLTANAFPSGSAAHALNVGHNTPVLPVKSIVNPQPPLNMIRSELNTIPYGNLTQDSVNIFRML